MSSPNPTEAPVETKRLLSLAYGYFGSLAEGEDIVQEALLRLEQSDKTTIRNVDAWLTTVVTRLCIDKLRSAQHRREVYPGEWLPEPIFNAPTPEQDAITRSRLSVGLLYLLENLEPEQRVVFILREVFEHSYRSIRRNRRQVGGCLPSVDGPCAGVHDTKVEVKRRGGSPNNPRSGR